MKNLVLTVVIAVLSSGCLLVVPEAIASQTVDELAQGCYAIQSPQTGRYVKQYHSGGTINDGENFAFRTSNLSDAAHFYFKPTIFKHFMLTNRNGRYLASRLPAEPTAGTYQGKFAEWMLTAVDQGNNNHRFKFKNVGLNRTLRHNFSSENFYYFDLLNPGNANSEDEFILVPVSDCVPYPEMQVNVSGDPDLLKGNSAAPVRGVVDAHTHIASNEFMGGKFVHGHPVHRYGVQSALNGSDGIHGPWGSLDLIGNIFAYDDINHRYDTRGWPEFPHWPNHRTVSHTGYYYKWIERAWLGGVRMMVSHMVENKVLCTVQSTVNPAAWINANSCEAKDSVRLQVQRHYEMQDYIDAQAGGPGKGFFRIVLSPEEAREVIADGKLAVIMGIEASEIFDCGVQGGCTRDSVEREMQEMYNLGIRGFFPTHRFDNKMGGSEIEDGLINLGQSLSAGYLFDVEHCDAHTHGAMLQPGFPLLGGIPVIGDIADSIADTPDYDPHANYCNQQGLTELGVYVVNRMIDMGMLIELDHTSNKTAAAMLDIIEARQYSGVISAHSHLQRGVNGQLHPNMKRLIGAGGFVAPYNANATDMVQAVGSYLDEVELTPYLNGVGIGTDMSGLANQPGPRDDAQALSLEYPFTSEFGLEFDRQVSGNRVIDYNDEGMAHYGMLADHIQDIRERAPDRIYEAIMNSAEAYLQMWERARGNSNNAYHNPLNQQVRIVNRHSGRCIGAPGDDDNVRNGVRVQQEGCEHKQADQRWVFGSQGRLRSAIDHNLCIDGSQNYRYGQPLLKACTDSDVSKWDYYDYNLRRRGSNHYTLDAEKGGSRIWLYPHHGDWNQDWELRTERDVYNWVTFRTAMGNGCLDVHNADTTNGNYFKLERCHDHPAQLFYYNPADGSLRSKLDANKCMDLPAFDTTNNTTIVIWDCNGGLNQQWDLDNGVFRSRLDRNKVIDVNGSHHGAEISIWDYHGRSNQRWRSVLQ